MHDQGVPVAAPDAEDVACAASDALVRPVVAVFRTWILPRSETFVMEQALALERWTPVLVGERRIDDPRPGHVRIETVCGPEPTLTQRALGAAYRRLDQPHPKLVRLIRDARPALIHAHFGYDGVEAWPAARRLGLPLLVTLHGGDVTIHNRSFESGRMGARWRRYPGRLSRLAREPRVHFIAVSESIKSAAIAKGLAAERITVQPIGVDLGRFHQAGPPIAGRTATILFVGRLVEKKGCAYLIEAFKAVKAALPHASLVIAGDGSERSALERSATLVPGVTFLGAVPHGRVRQLLTEARVLCLPSVTAANGNAEGFGMVLLEAQASGVPVVTSACGGAQEGILDGQTGFAFPERDVGALAAHLIRLLSDDVLADAFSRAGPAFVRDTFDIRQRTRELERLYDRIVAAHAGQHSSEGRARAVGR